MFPIKEQPEIDGDETPLFMPPPLFLAVFSVKVQLEMVGFEYKLYNPPPLSAEFPEKIQSMMVGAEWSLYMPPPVVKRPFVMVNPLTVMEAVPVLSKVMTRPVPFPSKIVATAPPRDTRENDFFDSVITILA